MSDKDTEFNVLLQELDEMKKSQGADIAKIKAAAVEGDGDGDEDGEDIDNDGDGANNGMPGAVMKKSMNLDGQQVEYVDPDEFMKAIDARIGAGQDEFKKALSGVMGVIKGQNELIKSLQEQVVKLGSAGAGRKSVLNVHETQAQVLAKSTPQQPTKEEIIAKSEAAWQAGKITGQEMTGLDVALRNNFPVNPDVIARVLS